MAEGEEGVQAVKQAMEALPELAWARQGDAIADIAGAGRPVRVPLGKALVRPGVMPDAVFLILKGRVRLLGFARGVNQPDVICSLGPGGLVGAAAARTGLPLEAATAAEETVCLMLPVASFEAFRSRHAGWAGMVDACSAPAALYAALTGEFERAATDLRRMGEAIKMLGPSARWLTVAEEGWVGWSPSSGGIWERMSGGLTREGIAVPEGLWKEWQAGGRDGAVGPVVPVGSDQPAEPVAPVAPELQAGRLPEAVKDYPITSIPADAPSSEEIAASFEMLANYFGSEYPRDAVRRVLRNEAREGREPSLYQCGAVAAMAGFSAQLVKVAATAVPRIEGPAVLRWEGAISILFAMGAHGAVIGHPRKGLLRPTVEEVRAAVGEGAEMLLVRPSPPVGEKFGFRWFLPALKRHRRSLIEVFVASFFVQMFALANPLLTQVIIDKVLVQNSLSTLNVLGILFVVIAVSGVLLSAVRTYLFVDTTNRIDMTLGARIMDHLYRLTLGYFHRRPVGEVSSRLGELENIRQFLTGTALTVGLDAVFAVVYVVILLFYSVPLTFVALAVTPFLAAVTVGFSPLLRKQIRERAEAQARSQAHLVETVTGVQTVKAGNLEQHARWEWQKRYANYVSAGFRAVLTSTAMGSANSLFGKLGDLAVLWYGAVLVIGGQLTLGQLIAFRIIAGYVTTPLLRLSQTWQSFQEVGLSIERLGDVMDSRAEQDAGEAAKIPMPALKGGVKFDGVTFGYDPAKAPQLRAVSFSVEPGMFVGVVGRSGSGKSTLLKLIPRLYAPQDGRIIVDGYEISKVELYSLRRQIGTVLQDSLLFNESVFANIAVGDPDATPEDVMQAARVADAHEFIMGLSNGYDTRVGEQGRGLSGGQRQRVAIARAVLQNPRMLILDEATSALDAPTEYRVCQNLLEATRGKTVFFVTHRVRSVARADHILVLDEGVLAEQGTHQQLLDLNGLYATLYKRGEEPS